MTSTVLTKREAYLSKIAFALAFFTIFYNLAEGVLATWLGFEDETLALFGFGVDSFIEMISGVGIAHMILGIFRSPHSERHQFEKAALRVTGYCFYLLTAGLLISTLWVLYTQNVPTTTLWGVVISAVSIVVMVALLYAKLKVGNALQSKSIIADAHCTRVCIYMSVVLLASSGLYELTQWFFIDAAGTAGLAWFSYLEGKECFEKVNNEHVCHC